MNTTKLFATLALASTFLAQSAIAQPTKLTASLPKAYTSAPSGVQSRTCGVMLFNFVASEVQTTATDKVSADARKMSSALLLSGLYHLDRTASLPTASKESALKLSKSLEAGDSKEQIAVVATCVRAATDAFSSGKVDKEVMRRLLSTTAMMMTPATGAPGRSPLQSAKP